ncbi:MAG: hypothetical protein M1355_02930 [Patescibacteria group bacterium]|nr:hypothetical protein [Patescibacteria group bacterium]
MVTEADLQRYVGGQAEIQNPAIGYLYRGEIKNIAIEANTLVLKFNWMAKGDRYPPLPNRWVNDQKIAHTAALGFYSDDNIGPNQDGGGDRLRLQSPIIGETIILFPPDGSKLDPTKVEGLVLA